MMSVMPPPPAPSNSGNSCWKWGAIGCGGLGCLGIIGMIALFYTVSKSPIFKEAMVAAQKSQLAMRDMQTLKTDINQYTKDKNKYPDKLTDLIPKYLPNERMLHVGGDLAEPSYVYSKPPKDAPHSFVILQVDLPSPMPSLDKSPWSIRMQLDGSIDGSNYQPRSGGRSLQTGPGSQ
jgi:hypothetical protein